MHQNQRGITVPLIKGHRSYLPQVPAVFEAGVTLEPFTSTIAHSCDPNSWIVFEGNKLRVRALRNIKPCEELTVSYIAGFLDYTE
jgi:hypothetical protein